MEYILIGKIKGTHGIKGEVKVESDSDFKAERFQKNETLYLKQQNQMKPIIINSFRIHKNQVLITFNNIININDVLEYLGCEVYANQKELPKLLDNEYYYYELIGLDVVEENNCKVGTIIDIQELPKGELLVIQKLDGKKVLVPFVGAFIKKVDINKKIMIITPIEGLL